MEIEKTHMIGVMTEFIQKAALSDGTVCMRCFVTGEDFKGHREQMVKDIQRKFGKAFEFKAAGAEVHAEGCGNGA